MLASANGAENVLLITGVVLLVIFAALTLVTRKLQNKRGQGASKVINLTPQHQLHIVELAGQNLLIGTGPQGAPRFLCELASSRLQSEAERNQQKLTIAPGHGSLSAIQESQTTQEKEVTLKDVS